MTEHDIIENDAEAHCISDGTGLCLTHPVCEQSASALSYRWKRFAELEALIDRTAAHVTGCDNLPPWEGALDAGVEAMARRIAALEELLDDNTSLRNLIQKQFIELREDKDKRIAELKAALKAANSKEAPD